MTTFARIPGVMAALLVAAAALLLVAWPVAPASAHSELIETVPASGATLTKAPTQVELVFGEGVQQEGSTIIVTTVNTVVSQPTSLAASGTTATIQLQPDLLPGTYTVAFRVLSDDGHIVKGSYTFDVRGRGESPSATTDVATPPTTPLAGEESGSDSDSDGGGAAFVWVLGAGAIGIALVAALIAVAVRGRRDRSN